MTPPLPQQKNTVPPHLAVKLLFRIFAQKTNKNIMEQRMRIAQHLAGYLVVAVVDDEYPL